MSNAISRPKRGLTPEAAFARWSDATRYQELVALAGTSDLPPWTICDNYIRDAARCKEYRAKRELLDEAMRERLVDGEIFASAIEKYAARRSVIHPTLWELLYIHFELDEIVGAGRTYEKPEFFTLDSIPLNVRPIPDWLDAELAAAGLNVFRHDSEYRHIVLHEMEYTLSPLHANVVKLLHEAWLRGEAWQRGEDVLELAGSLQGKMVDAFKSRSDWRTIIESDGKGMYRLRMDRSTMADDNC